VQKADREKADQKERSKYNTQGRCPITNWSWRTYCWVATGEQAFGTLELGLAIASLLAISKLFWG
jgi:hypothetical protein